MSYCNRRSSSEEFNVWPSLTDVITGVFLFLILIFIIMIIQQFLYFTRLSRLEKFLGTLEEDMENLEREFGAESGISIDVKQGRIVLQEHVLFGFDSSHIKFGSQNKLKRIGESLKSILDRHPELLAVNIDGHTDNVGSYFYNLSLGSKRSIAVLSFLAKHAEIEPNKYDISANTYGEYRPVIAHGHTKAEPLNRRIEIRIIPKFGRLLEELKNR